MICPLETPTQRQDMLDLLDVLREHVESGQVSSLLAVEVRSNLDEPTMLHNASDIHYAEIVGYLEMAKMDLHAKAAGIIEP